MSLFRKSSIPLQIRELAVDPADVDEETYPVRLRLSRALTLHEAEALATASPELRAEGDAVVVPDARIDDIAHDLHDWAAKLESAEQMAAQMEGQDAIAAHQQGQDFQTSQADGSGWR